MHVCRKNGIGGRQDGPQKDGSRHRHLSNDAEPGDCNDCQRHCYGQEADRRCPETASQHAIDTDPRAEQGNDHSKFGSKLPDRRSINGSNCRGHTGKQPEEGQSAQNEEPGSCRLTAREISRQPIGSDNYEPATGKQHMVWRKAEELTGHGC